MLLLYDRLSSHINHFNIGSYLVLISANEHWFISFIRINFLFIFSVVLMCRSTCLNKSYKLYFLSNISILRKVKFCVELIHLFAFQSPNKPTIPQEKIRPLTSLDHPQSPFYDPEGGAITPVARVVVERIARKVLLFRDLTKHLCLLSRIRGGAITKAPPPKTDNCAGTLDFEFVFLFC